MHCTHWKCNTCTTNACTAHIGNGNTCTPNACTAHIGNGNAGAVSGFLSEWLMSYALIKDCFIVQEVPGLWIVKKPAATWTICTMMTKVRFTTMLLAPKTQRIVVHSNTNISHSDVSATQRIPIMSYCEPGLRLIPNTNTAILWRAMLS